MEVKWINGESREDTRIFDSTWEAEEWADSLYSDFAGEGFINVGYAHPDRKVFEYFLVNKENWVRSAMTNPYLPELVFMTEETTDSNGNPLYKVWMTPKRE